MRENVDTFNDKSWDTVTFSDMIDLTSEEGDNETR